MNLEQMILLKMNPSWSLLEKARFIYVELGKLVSFSTKFQNTDERSFTELYLAKVSIYKLESLEVNCRMWAQLYSQLLYSANIPNRIIDKGHSYVEFYINEKKFVADATNGTYTDLARIKNDDDTIHFGYSIDQNIDHSNNAIRWSEEWKNELNNVDEKIGYNSNQKNDLMDLKHFLIDVKNNSIDIKSLAHTDVEDLITFKLEYLFSRLGKLNDGYYESKDFVRELEGLFFTPEEMGKIGAVELKRTNQDKSVNIIQCIYTKHNEDNSYYLLAPNLPVQRFSVEDILSLAKKGYGIESKAIPGIMYSQKFIPGKKSEKFSYRLYKSFKSSKTEIDEYAEQKARAR